MLKPFTVIYVLDNDITWQFLNCNARNADHAELLCRREFPEASIIWVNEGHNVFTMD